MGRVKKGEGKKGVPGERGGEGEEVSWDRRGKEEEEEEAIEEKKGGHYGKQG